MATGALAMARDVDEPDEALDEAPVRTDTKEREPAPLRGRNKNGTPTTRGVAPGMIWINCRVSTEENALLDEWSARSGLSKSKIIRFLVQEAIRDGRHTKVGLPR